MVQKTVVHLFDDLDNLELRDGGKTVAFAFQQTQYEIDLSNQNAQKLHDVLAPYIAAGRRVSGRTSSTAGGGVRADPAQLSAMRRWAKDNGMQVSPRGRIPRNVQEAYHAGRSPQPT